MAAKGLSQQYLYCAQVACYQLINNRSDYKESSLSGNLKMDNMIGQTLKHNFSAQNSNLVPTIATLSVALNNRYVESHRSQLSCVVAGATGLSATQFTLKGVDYSALLLTKTRFRIINLLSTILSALKSSSRSTLAPKERRHDQCFRSGIAICIGIDY